MLCRDLGMADYMWRFADINKDICYPMSLTVSGPAYESLAVDCDHFFVPQIGSIV